MIREKWLNDTGPVLCVADAGPNFMKTAPISRAFDAHRPWVPTVRDNTERPTTAHLGTNTSVGRDPRWILRGVSQILDGGGKRGRLPELSDGRAAERIVGDLASWSTRRRVPTGA